MKLLTIAIPTFNRSTLLESSLENIIAERRRQGLEDAIDLVVLDNCSTDSTEAACKRFENVRHFRYKRHSSNLGPEQNFYECIQEAHARYTWILSDDDWLLEDTLTRLCEAIQAHDVGSFVLNFDGYQGSRTNLIFRKYISIDKDMAAERLRNLASVPCASACFGFISAFIYRTEVAKAADWQYYLDFKSLFAHFGVIVRHFFDLPAVILHNSMVLERCEGWRDEMGIENGFSLGTIDKFLATMRLNQSFVDDKLLTLDELNAFTYRNGGQPDCYIGGMLDRPLKLAIMKNNGLAINEFNTAMSYVKLFKSKSLQEKLIASLKAGLMVRFGYDLLMRM